MEENKFTYLYQLEAESIYIIREVAAEFENPVMLYSIGKDSSVMLHLARKAFYPSKLPFPLLHIDTGWKFNEMYKFRDNIIKDMNIDFLIHINKDGVEMGIDPFVHGSNKYTDIMKTEGLKQALNKYNFDAAFGGARRDEEKSRAKERIYSFRDKLHRWEPKKQRPELWQNYNGQINKGENIRVFPLSNWTELDIWTYIYFENIEIVPLYFSSIRPVLKRNNLLIMLNDNRINYKNEEINKLMVRFRTLGCWPLSGAIESNAKNVPEIINEMLYSKISERQGRIIDNDQVCSMEMKKRQGYF
ncbi:sulfate adenylyltransferase subunit CysD [Candidatus Purcelliella pentastirinorum]|uniref:sulfate adenylyltransferase subunit CysD n=1 Tax=Candidatus Purcelliella pentastirinorum TaxID=472834 RepID=UPI002367812F|nr:sulfate adenylyltransferase subunit CysD [Candidatus Purcelliella pentastirinorum]WDI79003.1 sulfate adenylyltransferase subunit CysD [Candidatus Purcelliella pentastirinorum]WDR80140.1 sulfate adenylyltransferase subunit CysD [Candidatus Purcelliella pentastirinorum]